MKRAAALSFTRERYGYAHGDFQRIENQQLVVEAIANKVLTQASTQILGIVQALAGIISTDYDVADLVSLVQAFQQAYPYVSFYSCMMLSTTDTEGEESYTITLDDEWKQLMALVDSGQDSSAAIVRLVKYLCLWRS